MNKFHMLNKHYFPFGRSDALKIAEHHARVEHLDHAHPDYRDTVNLYMSAFDYTRNMLVHLGSLTDKQKLKAQTYKFYKAKSCRLAAVLVAAFYKQSDEKRGVPEGLTRALANDWAHKCRVLANDHEAYERVLITTSTGKIRETWKFGIIRLAQQTMAGWLLIAQRELPGYDFFAPSSFPGKRSRGGIHGAAKSFGRALDDGFRYWAVADLKNAYPSMSRAIVNKLFTLDPRVLRYVVLPTLKLSHPYPYRGDTNQNASQPQLPQGSAHAWIILSALIGDVLQLNFRDVWTKKLWLVVYADNIAIGAQDILSAHSALRAVQAKLFAYPSNGTTAAGKLILHEMRLFDGYYRRDYGAPELFEGIPVYNSIDFCGYRIRKDIQDCEIKFSPSGEAWRRFWNKLQRKFLEQAEDIEDFELFIRMALERFDTWAPQFKLWKHQAEARMLVEVQAIEKHEQLLAKTRQHSRM